jgi:hypothetical protein
MLAVLFVGLQLLVNPSNPSLHDFLLLPQCSSAQTSTSVARELGEEMFVPLDKHDGHR